MQRRPTRNRAPAVPSYLQPPKLRVIDFAFERFGVRSFADLGGVWAVGAGYTFYALDRPGVERGVLVDTGITPAVRDRAREDSRLSLVDGDFGDPRLVEEIEPVDAVLLFDVLLHQVDPDWDAVLATWARRATIFVIVNSQLRDATEAVRLLDLGREEYAGYVPRDHIEVEWQRLDQVDPRYGKPFRDIHEYWQWGIPDAALHEVMSGLGRRLHYYADHGPWRDVPPFENTALVYAP